MAKKTTGVDKWAAQVTSGANVPFWYTVPNTSPSLHEQLKREDRLKSNLTADVCVVGGGIAGLSIGYQCAKAGKSVVLLEDGDLCSGETGRTTAHIQSAFDDRYVNVRKMHGPETARVIAASHSAAIEEIERIVKENNIECDFTRLDGLLFNAAPTDDTGSKEKEEKERQKKDFLQKELEACHEAGLVDVEMVSVPYFGSPSAAPAPCLRFPRQAQFHPLKYIVGLAAAFEKLGGRIFTHTHAKNFKGLQHPEHPRHVCEVETKSGVKVQCEYIAVATNIPVNDHIALVDRLPPYRSCAIALEVLSSPSDAASHASSHAASHVASQVPLPQALMWDTADPYHYVRLYQDPETNRTYAIVGGEDYKVSGDVDAEEKLAHLEHWARQHFGPVLGQVVSKWSGQVLEPVDQLAMIGHNPLDHNNVLIATGDSGTGLTHATIAGLLLRDIILGVENPWAKTYDPSRLSLGAAKDFLQYNLSSGVNMVKGLLKPGDISDIEELPVGCGAVMREGLHKVAVYRDANGVIHKCSAVCPHLSGIVEWNDSEKTFDCPLHGSRFSAYGKVLNGPSNADLPRVS